jgi:hypothetical protein
MRKQIRFVLYTIAVAIGGLVLSWADFAGLFEAGNVFWAVGASLSQTLFAGGTLVHRKRAA